MSINRSSQQDECLEGIDANMTCRANLDGICMCLHLPKFRHHLDNWGPRSMVKYLEHCPEINQTMNQILINIMNGRPFRKFLLVIIVVDVTKKKKKKRNSVPFTGWELVPGCR